MATPSQPAIPQTPSSRAAFRHPGFRLYMAARFLTAACSEMQAVAVAWQVYGMTHRPLDLGLVGLAQFLPGILLFLVVGQAALPAQSPRRTASPGRPPVDFQERCRRFTSAAQASEHPASRVD